MTACTVRTFALRGVEAFDVDVAAEVEPGHTSFRILGMPLAREKEASVRIRSALGRLGRMPECKATVRIPPECRASESLDLPIAIAVLGAMRAFDPAVLPDYAFAGELALDGRLCRIEGVLPMAMRAAAASGLRALIVPVDSAPEGAAVGTFNTFGTESLDDVLGFLRGEHGLVEPEKVVRSAPMSLDLREVRGLETAKRALEIAAAGGHNILLVGPPGSGKHMLARSLPGILPPMSEAEALEAAAIWSAAGKFDGASLLSSRPFRAPHQGVSVAGLVGGGPASRPGEASLAHSGVLFLDELPEFRRDALEALGHVLDEGCVTLVRQGERIAWPARTQLVAAMNPCSCGWRGSSLRACTCSEAQVRRFRARISGMLDRFDLHVEVDAVDFRALRSAREGEPSAAVRERVAAARTFSDVRTAEVVSAMAEGRPSERAHLELDGPAERHLEACVRRFAISARASEQILRVARTIADLAGEEHISTRHVVEAIALRILDRE